MKASAVSSKQAVSFRKQGTYFVRIPPSLCGQLGFGVNGLGISCQTRNNESCFARRTSYWFPWQHDAQQLGLQVPAIVVQRDAGGAW